MKKILIVEDELAYANLLTAQLEKVGYDIITATNGKSALQKAKTDKPDLILLDIRMPLMDGITMLSLLRKEKDTKDIIVVMLTNLEPDDKIMTGVITDAPAHYFIKSDTKLDTLIEKIEALLAK